MANYTASDISEQLFQAVDAIVQERLKQLNFDKTIIATITNNDKRNFGCYQVSTDNNINFKVYSEIKKYNIGDKVYIRIPEGDYTKQKVIIGRYISEDRNTIIPELESEQINELTKLVNKILSEKGGN